MLPDGIIKIRSCLESRYQRLRGQLAALKRHAAAEALPTVLDQAATEQLSLTAALEQLLAIEVDATEARRLAGRLRFACLPTPVTLQSFDLDAGCPPGGPPPGFQECHSTLNKDGPNTERGSQPVPGTNMNMFDLAAQLATRATTDLYTQIRALVASNNGENAATMLFQSGGQTFSLPGLANVYPGK